MQYARPTSCSRKSKVGMFHRNQSYYDKPKKYSSSPMVASRLKKGVNSVDRLSHRSTNKYSENKMESYSQSKRSYKYVNSNLKISLNGIDSCNRSPHSTRVTSRGGNSSNRANDHKHKKNLKSCKSMRSIGSRGSYSTRSRKEEN